MRDERAERRAPRLLASDISDRHRPTTHQHTADHTGTMRFAYARDVKHEVKHVGEKPTVFFDTREFLDWIDHIDNSRADRLKDYTYIVWD